MWPARGESNRSNWLTVHSLYSGLREARPSIHRTRAICPTSSTVFRSRQYARLTSPLRTFSAFVASLRPEAQASHERDKPGTNEAFFKQIEINERDYLKDLMRRCNDNVSRAAREAGIDRVHLHRLLKKHAVE